MAVIKRDTKRGTALTLEGVALWARLGQPDTKFSPDGEYRTQLILNADDVEEVRAILEEERELAIEQAVADELKKKPKAKPETVRMNIKVVDLPLKALEDAETGELTGDWAVTAKTRHAGVSKKTGKPWKFVLPLFDGQAKAIRNPENEMIFNGSAIKINVTISPYNVPTTGVGVTLRLQGAQIIQKADGGASAGSMGFGAEADGYEYDGDIAESANEALGGNANDAVDAYQDF